MSVRSFKFVSPGVFINEIDNSFRPRRPDAIGPVIVGRSVRGLAMQPVKVESYSDFLTMYGDTVPGNAGGDIYRDGNFQSPMYGTYAAKAFLNASVAPVTYVRLLGVENDSKTAAGVAGWKTTKDATPPSPATQAENGGAWGLWVFPSSSGDAGGSATSDLGTGTLAAVWYIDQSASIQLSGALARSTDTTQGVGVVIASDASGYYTVNVLGSKAQNSTNEKITFNFDDTDQRFVRKVFNTNPQLVKDGTFYDASLERNYWLGETFEQELRDGGEGSITGSATTLVGSQSFGVILPIEQGGVGPAQMQVGTQEAQTGWIIGQDLGAAASFVPSEASKLFKLTGRGHGEWLNKNVKISVEKIRYSNTQTSDYGTFSVVLRSLTDTDNNVVVLERFDNLTLDPTSPNYIVKRIGNQYYSWNEGERRLRLYGDYPNQSKFVYVSDINEGNIQNANSLIPFGYYGPPNFTGITSWSGSTADPAVSNTYISTGNTFGTSSVGAGGLLSGSGGNFTGSLVWPVVRLRHSASDGGMSDQTDAYFGMQASRTRTSTRGDVSVKDYHRLWLASGWTDTDGTGTIGSSSQWTMLL